MPLADVPRALQALGGSAANWLSSLKSAVDAATGLSDGDKGDVVVSSSGTVWTLDPVGTAKLGGDITTAGKNLLDDADVAAQRTTLGLGTVAVNAASGWATLTVSTSAPGSPATGDLWVDTN